jgi:hypothetical protein
MNNMLIHFVSKGNRGIGCVVAYRQYFDTGLPHITLGWSKCLIKPTVTEREAGIKPDRYNKQEALSIAKYRAISHRHYMELDTAENVNSRNAYLIPGDIRPHLRNMAKRARRYFKVP